MDNIITYLRWRGDLTFESNPFSEVDNLILSEFVYIDLKEVVPGIGESKSISIEDIWMQKEHIPLRDERKKLLEAMAASGRYQKIRLQNYQEFFETEGEGVQFAAVEICLPDGTSYIAFRGTDLSIVGWKEDFSMGYKIVPAQKKAVAYLNQVIKTDGFYRLGGHSKGGNLAVYGAMMCEPTKKEQIIEIYSNDGPGLSKDLLDVEKYNAIQNKIIKIVPAFSIFGQLFENRETMKIVKSNAPGFQQHDGMNWQVEGGKFVEVPELDPECVFYNKLFDEWIENASMDERERFVTEFFAALESADVIRMDELLKSGPQTWKKVLVSMKNTDRKAKVTLGKFISSAWRKIRQVSLLDVVRERKAIPWLILLVLGIFFLSFPHWFGRVLGTLVFLAIFVFSVFQLFRYEKQRRESGIFQNIELLFIFLSVMVLLCIINGFAAVLSTNAALGIFFACQAYRRGQNAIQSRLKKQMGRLIVFSADALISSGLCIISFITSASVNDGFMMTVGTYLIITSAVELGRRLLEKASEKETKHRH